MNSLFVVQLYTTGDFAHNRKKKEEADMGIYRWILILAVACLVLWGAWYVWASQTPEDNNKKQPDRNGVMVKGEYVTADHLY